MPNSYLLDESGVRLTADEAADEFLIADEDIPVVTIGFSVISGGGKRTERTVAY